MLAEWETYLETLCKNYKPLGHLSNGKRAWVPYGSDEVAPEKGNLKPNYVKHVEFDAQGEDYNIWKYTSSLQVLVNANIAKGNAEGAIRQARQLALKIAQQLDARIISDFEDGTTCSTFGDLGQSRLTPVGMVDESAYGWQLDINFSNYRPDVDTDEWEE